MPPNYAMLLYNKGVFASAGTIERIVVRDRGVIVGAWDITVCRDFRGIAGYKQNPLVRQAAKPGSARRS
jgi:hypothetical protein